MSGDPFRIFREDPSRAETLKILWPALYDCLAEIKAGGKADNLRCVLGVHPLGQGPPAVARIVDRYGPPACRGCLAIHHGPTHQGWPLKQERVTRR